MKRFYPIFGLALGIALGLVIAAIIGENPLDVMRIIFKSAFGSRYDFGVTLYYTTALIFTGLSVSVAFHAGLFNIGAEGQLAVGTLAASIFAITFPELPPLLAVPAVFLVAIFAGGFWGFVPGYLKAKRGSHEVINTIMMNFLAAALCSWAITTHFQNPERQSPETSVVSAQYFFRAWDPLPVFFQDAPVSTAFFVAVLAAVGLWAFLFHTPLGFRIRATGENEDAARVAGISVAGCKKWAMFLAGSFAGLVALNEVFGGYGKMRLGFSPDFGFIGIAVALLARSHPLGVLGTAFLFGALHKGAADLDIETDLITKDLSFVIQSLVILTVSVAIAFQERKRK
jgi:ABC-type uncharacterized transport system permease subunit